ncbi:MAG TPA: O-antigen ligase family protein [Bacteroidia bacterium]|jgi:O-antigen ligase|nr:O-antigen ligase family protein [Bacteroidia bacterium]
MIKLQDIFPESEKTVNKVLVALLALVVFFLPFKFLVNLFIVLALITWLAGNPFKALFTKNKFTKCLLAILVFYLLHAIAFFYTNNIEESFFSLEIKISLLIFPLIFYTENYTWHQMKFFVRSFVLGNLLCCLLCLGHAGYLTLTEEKNYFFYQDLSWFQHPSYFSMYLTFSSVALLQKKIFTRLQNLLCLVIFTLFILLLSSKTGITIHFLFLLMVGVAYFLGKGNYLKVALFALASGLVLFLLVYFVPPVKERFQNVVRAFDSDKTDKSATESTAVRMLIWQEAKKIIKKKPLLGVSPGDANDALYASYKEHGLTGAYEKKLNAHSQYFQTGVGLGFVGLTSLLAMFILPFFQKPRKLLVFFLLISAVNFLTESMLQTMAGCIFFGYFYALLCFDKELNPKKF